MSARGAPWYRQWGLILGFYGAGEPMLGPALREFFETVCITGSGTPLCEIMTLRSSDKGFGRHNYTLLYDFLFHDRRNEIRNLLEIGIGTPADVGPGYIPGASLRGWRDYFSNARIVGADIDRSVLFTEDRISTFYIDQTDRQSILDLWNSLSGMQFDIIVDDGLHEFAANATLMANSFDKLKPGGFYIIEDIVLASDNLKKFDAFFRQFGAPGALVRLLNPLNTFDNCLAIFRRSGSADEK